MENDHRQWMELALLEAKAAADVGEVPVGAVIVNADGLLATGRNDREASQSPLGHAEIRAVEKAVRKVGSWRLEGCTIYVTLEPCIMCMGALLQSRVEKLVFGARDPKAGAVRSLYELASDQRLNHVIEVVEGVLEEESSKMLKEFFKKLRNKS